MGSDFKRTLLWVVFLSSLFMLWDSWQVYNGRPSFFGPAQEQSAAASSAAASAGSIPASAQASANAVNASADSAESVKPVNVQTDLMKLTFDEQGASVVRAELLKMKELPKWNEVGLVGLILGNKEAEHNNVVLFDHSKDRLYEAQSGVIGVADAPTHKTVFKLQDGPLVMNPGDKTLSVRFEAESGGVKVLKTYTFTADHYGMQVTQEVVNGTDKTINPSIYYQLVRDSKPAPGSNSFSSSYLGAALYTAQDKFQKITFEHRG